MNNKKHSPISVPHLLSHTCKYLLSRLTVPSVPAQLAGLLADSFSCQPLCAPCKADAPVLPQSSPFWWKMKALSCSRWKFFPQLVIDRNVFSGSHLMLPSGRREILMEKMKGLNCSQFITFNTGPISSPKYSAPLGWRFISLRNLHSYSCCFCISLPFMPTMLAFHPSLWPTSVSAPAILTKSLEISSVHDPQLASHSQEAAAEYEAPSDLYNSSDMQCPDLQLLFSTAPPHTPPSGPEDFQLATTFFAKKMETWLFLSSFSILQRSPQHA